MWDIFLIINELNIIYLDTQIEFGFSFIFVFFIIVITVIIDNVDVIVTIMDFIIFYPYFY